MDFFTNIDTPLDFFILLLAFGVVFVNGWTDAPNAICSCVISGRLSIQKASLLSGIFNLLGVALSCLLFPSVSKSMLDFGNGASGHKAKIICLSCFLCVIIFGVVCWLFGMPSSESHALIFSLCGATLSVYKNSQGLFIKTISLVIFTVFSLAISFFITHIFFVLLRKKRLPYDKLLIFSCASISFMHGAQDGQKFVGILMLLVYSSSHENGGSAPILAVALVGLIMSLSTLLGGAKIIRSMGKISKKTDTRSAFLSDIGAFLGMGICSLLGMPVSTGNIKASTLLAAGILEGERINKRATIKIFLTSFVTLPICFLIGFALGRLLLFVF